MVETGFKPVSTAYNETQLRREFVDPFFTMLGWDVDNESAIEWFYDKGFFR